MIYFFRSRTLKILWGLFLTSSLLAGGKGAAYGQGHERDPFKARFEDRLVQVHPGQTFVFSVRFQVPKGFYLYDDKTSLLFNPNEAWELIHTERPSPEEHFDPFLKKMTQVFFRDFEIKATFRVGANVPPGRRTLEGTLRYQGCSADFCYRPVKKAILVPVEVVPPETAIQAPPAKPEPRAEQGPPEARSFWDWVGETNPEKLLNQGKVYLLGLALFGGILTSLTPCVLPIVPLTLAFIGVRHRRRGNLLRAAMLVLGMVTMYSLLGFAAASLGLKLGFLFQSRWFVLITSLFFLIFALGLFEVIPFHLPPKWHNRLVKMGGDGPWGAYVAGLTVGLIASPCVGPLIAPLLLIAAREQDRIYGFALLFNYGLGMGLLFLVLGSAYVELAGKVKSGKWTHALKRVLGLLMLGPAIYYGLAFARPFLQKPEDGFWVYSLNRGLQIAQEKGRPVLLDFYADWCPPCIELDKRTFASPEVRQAAQAFVMVKVDCTTDDEACRRATARYEVVGWPTVLFLMSDGTPIPDVKLVGGFADKDRMLELMRRALTESPSGAGP